MNEDDQTQCMVTKMMPFMTSGPCNPNTPCCQVTEELRQACVGFACRDEFVNPKYCTGQRADCVAQFVMQCNKGRIMGLDRVVQMSYQQPMIRQCLKSSSDVINALCANRNEDDCDQRIGVSSLRTPQGAQHIIDDEHFGHYCEWDAH